MAHQETKTQSIEEFNDLMRLMNWGYKKGASGYRCDGCATLGRIWIKEVRRQRKEMHFCTCCRALRIIHI